MNPLRLRLEGFRSFGELDLDMPAGCVSVTGTNGAGKSSLIDAIDVALFGPEGRSFASYLRAGAPRLLLELELEHAGDRYRIRRTFNGRRATLDVEVRGGPNENEWASFTQATVADTQALVEHELGLTRETFRASALVRQGDGAAFTEAQPRDRKRILAAALSLASWEEAAERARADHRAAAREVAELDGAIAATRAQLHDAGDVGWTLTDARGRLAELAGEIETDDRAREAAQAELEQAVTAEAKLSAATAELAAARREFQRVDEQRNRAAAAAARLTDLESRLRELDDELARQSGVRAMLEQARAQAVAHAEFVRERADLEAQLLRFDAALDEITVELGKLDETHVEPKCPTCGQTLAGGSLEAARERISAAFRDTSEAADAAREKLDGLVEPQTVAEHTIAELEQQDRDSVDAAARRRVLAETIDELRSQTTIDPDEHERLCTHAAAEVVALETRIAGMPEPTPGGAAALRARLDEVNRRQAAARTLHTEQTALVARLEALAERVKAANDTLAEQLTRSRDATAAAADLEVLVRAFGRDGVPAWIVEHHALPAIEAEANRILAVLGGPVERLELRTERELASGETTDALDILCVTDTGDRDYSTFSGGERTRVNLALRIALARLLARRRGSDVRLLAIDEPDGLDEQGMGALVDVLRGLVNRGEFSTALLASHVPALRDAFDRSIAVDRSSGGSRVEVS